MVILQCRRRKTVVQLQSVWGFGGVRGGWTLQQTCTALLKTPFCPHTNFQVSWESWILLVVRSLLSNVIDGEWMASISVISEIFDSGCQHWCYENWQVGTRLTTTFVPGSWMFACANGSWLTKRQRVGIQSSEESGNTWKLVINWTAERETSSFILE